MIERAIATLDLLEHRGAAGADADTGDGAGILIQLPHEFFRARAAEFGVEPEDVPGPGELAVAMCFLPADPDRRLEIGHRIEEMVRAEGQIPLGSREVPDRPDPLRPRRPRGDADDPPAHDPPRPRHARTPTPSSASSS